MDREAGFDDVVPFKTIVGGSNDHVKIYSWKAWVHEGNVEHVVTQEALESGAEAGRHAACGDENFGPRFNQGAALDNGDAPWFPAAPRHPGKHRPCCR